MDKNTKINVTKTENGTYIIRMADFYPGYNGETEFQEVSREVYEYLRSEKRREYREKSLDNYWRASFGFDEVMIAEIENIFTEPVDVKDNKKDTINAVRYALEQLPEDIARRLYMYCGLNMKSRDIAKIEGISSSAVLQSVYRGKEMMRGILEGMDYLFA